MSRRSKMHAAILIATVSLITLAGCSTGGGSSGGGSTGGNSLDGTQWRLTEWTLSSLSPAEFTITAKFAGGQVSGNSGVNSYSGPYDLGPGNAFSVGQLAVTQMAGPEPAMRAESAYLTLLAQAKSFKTADGKLTLYDQGGNESLIFEAVGK